MRPVYISVLLFLISLKSFSQTNVFGGKITDQQGRPIAFSSVWINETQQGALTNGQGFYHLTLKPGTYTIGFRSPGYNPLFETISVESNVENHHVILNETLPSSRDALKADSIIRKVIEKRNSPPFQLPVYSGQLYRKAVQRVIKMPKIPLKKDIAHELNIDITRKGIINLSESISEFRTRPQNYLTEDVSAAKKASNSINVFNFDRSPDLHVDLYQNILHFNGFNEHGFVSPIADNALSYYSFKLTSRFTDQGHLIDEISVTPIHHDEHLFSGYIYVVDQSSDLYSVNLNLTKNAHLYFIDSVKIYQQFVPLDNHKWEPQATQFSFFGKFWHFQYSGSFLQVFQDIHTDTAKTNGPYHEVYHSTKEAYLKDAAYWREQRPVTLNAEEQKFYQVMALKEKQINDRHLDDSLKNKNNRFRWLPFMLRGYTLHNYYNNTSWSFQSPYNVVFFNTVEGWGLDLKVKYIKQYDSLHSITIVPEARYGFSDKVLNTNIFANYMYNPFRQASVYARVGSDFLDLNNTGTVSLFLNSLSTLFLGSNYLKLYQSKFIQAGTAGEVANGILLNGQVEYADRRPLFNTNLNTYKDSTLLTSNNPLDPNADVPLFPHYRALTIRGSATFTFDQEYMITPTGKFILPNPYPRLRINYREGLPVFGSSVNYNFASVDVFQDRLNTCIYGYTAYFLSAGAFLSARNLYYPDYMQFGGGESFFFNSSAGRFHFLNYYTYSTDKAYFEAHAEHNFAGYFLSHVPLVNRLNLEEIIGGSYLSQGTLPAYKEVYIGLKRTAVRLDYGFAFGRYSSTIQGFRLVYNF